MAHLSTTFSQSYSCGCAFKSTTVPQGFNCCVRLVKVKEVPQPQTKRLAVAAAAVAPGWERAVVYPEVVRAAVAGRLEHRREAVRQQQRSGGRGAAQRAAANTGRSARCCGTDCKSGVVIAALQPQVCVCVCARVAGLCTSQQLGAVRSE